MNKALEKVIKDFNNINTIYDLNREKITLYDYTEINRMLNILVDNHPATTIILNVGNWFISHNIKYEIKGIEFKIYPIEGE